MSAEKQKEPADFESLGVDKKLIEGLKMMGITSPTPIQASCIPPMKQGKDVVGQSLTGSGKTAAFGLPLLEKVIPGNGIQALVLTPTRELCVQVRDSIETMGRYSPINIISIYGGTGFYDQMEGIKIAEVVVATPGRLLDHINRRNIRLDGISLVVLDEADKMFEMGFEEDVDKILSYTPKTRQTVLFSATMPRAAQNIVHKYLKNPVFIKEQLHVDRSLLKQVYYVVKREEKFPLLVHLLKNKTAGPAIVFCGTKIAVSKISRGLHKQKIEALPVHGDLSQTQRLFAVNSFKKGRIDVLVATDVAARGLDIKDVTHVYNFDVPRTPEEYTHRIGRTARAGKKGDAVTLLSERDYDNFERILKSKKFEILEERVPQFEFVSMQQPFEHERGGHYAHGRGDRRHSGRGYAQERSHSRGYGRSAGGYPERGYKRHESSGGGYGHSRPRWQGPQGHSRPHEQSREQFQSHSPSHEQRHSHGQGQHAQQHSAGEQREAVGGYEHTPRTYEPRLERPRAHSPAHLNTKPHGHNRHSEHAQPHGNRSTQNRQHGAHSHQKRNKRW